MVPQAVFNAGAFARPRHPKPDIVLREVRELVLAAAQRGDTAGLRSGVAFAAWRRLQPEPGVWRAVADECCAHLFDDEAQFWAPVSRSRSLAPADWRVALAAAASRHGPDAAAELERVRATRS
jgi:hypothetical protein